jgi:cytochrome c
MRERGYAYFGLAIRKQKRNDECGGREYFLPLRRNVRSHCGSTIVIAGDILAENAKNAVGPVLNGVIGRQAGSVAGYSYSDANKDSGITWDEPTFREYIRDPKAKVPGTKMIYPGLKDEQKTNDLVAFLKQFDADGKKR